MSRKIKLNIELEPEDLEWISRMVEQRKKENPDFSSNLLISEAIATLREKLEEEDMDMDQFADYLGFDSADALLVKASEIIIEDHDIRFYVTRLPDGRYAAWDDSELSPYRVSYFDTREEAVEFHRKRYEQEEIFKEALRIIVGADRTVVTCYDCGIYQMIDLVDGKPVPGQDCCPECGEKWSPFKEKESEDYVGNRPG